MALVFADRVKETSTTTGTGTYTLAGAVVGFQSFAAIGNTNTCYYCATDETDWEVGLGTYTAAGTTLARTAILASSNAGAAVNWAAGTRAIFCDIPALIAGQARATVIKKASAQAVASASLTNDADFTFPLLANTKYAVEIYADINHGAASDFQFDITGPASPNSVSIVGEATSVNANALVFGGKGTGFSTAVQIISGSPAMITLKVWVFINNGANAGTFQFRWANVAGTTSNTMGADSWLKYEVVN